MVKGRKYAISQEEWSVNMSVNIVKARIKNYLSN